MPLSTQSARSRYSAYAAVALVLLGTAAMFLDRLFPPPLEQARRTSIRVLDAQGRLLHGFTTVDERWRLPLRPADVDPLYLKMLKAYEDRRFDRHPGVDPLAVARAIGQWIRYSRVVSGASTLTMQAARLLEPRPRTLAGKLMETVRALQLEWHYDKDQILSWYLTLAPYGGNLEGLRAASLAWLGKEPRRLTPAEAALLVVLPQAPSRLRPDRFPDQARAARDKVLARMVQVGVLSPRQAVEAAQEAIPRQRRDLPFHAPHLARRLRATYPQQTLHRAFIDGDLQRTLEALARQQPLAAAASLAVLVVDNAGRQVIGYVGAGDFFATTSAGQVDMVRAVRSPGSALKPLIYGMGFDEGLIHPETLIDDTPERFGDYAPANFDHGYQGWISIREALQRSLNVPAVRVLEQLGPLRVAARLREAGIALHWDRSYGRPGLPLALGGVGLTLEDLVTLYAGIAGGGIVAPLRFSTADPAVEGRFLLSAAASEHLTRILEDTAPPETFILTAHHRQPRPIAYKTGTSYGFRDAWALGYDSAYTVGVWVGRPDGSPSPGHHGRNTAAPLLFRVFGLLPAGAVRSASVPVQGAIPAERKTLPEGLRYFRARPASGHSDPQALTIRFPVSGAKVELATSQGRLADLPLVADGGQRPLRWLVNGLPLASSPLRRQTFWTPDGEGLVRVTVIDALGRTAGAEVWLEKISP